VDISCAIATSPETPEHVEIDQPQGLDIAREPEAFLAVRSAVG
jgi:hypothetical protein